jgi:hypothetical protein
MYYDGSQLVCQKPKCGGVMFNVTSILAASLGVMHLKCEKCKQTYAINTTKEQR